MIIVLAVAAGTLWAELLSREGTATLRVSCPPIETNPPVQPLGVTALDPVAPLPPEAVRVRVLNSTRRAGLAARVAARLRLFGFARAAPPANDPLYPTGTMHCVGQIRFGRNGGPAARTLSLLAPCAQLVRDDRDNRTVDLAVGTGFTRLWPNRPARAVLRQLNAWSRQHPPPAGGQQSDGGAAPPLSPALLAKARSGRC